MYRNYITWEQSFKEVNESILRHKIIISITNEMFNGDFNNLSTFTNDQKDEVWNNYYNTTELCN